MAIELTDVLKLAGFDPALRTRVVRHKTEKYNVKELRRRDWLELYQAYQSRNVFDGIKQVVSLYGLSGNRAGFYGVYKVERRRPGTEGPILAECEWSKEWNHRTKFFYDLDRDRRFDDLRDRIIIEWPGRNWVQKLKNKLVLEILPPGRKLRPFEDYLEFSLSYQELKDLFDHSDAHRDWRTPLRAVAGVYLILAETSGDLYVGSAYGPDGIWGRWRAYAATGHGGDVKLKKLIREDSLYPDRFRFSVLHVLPKSMAPKEVIQREVRYKEKLGSRAHGLNS